jgi:hypothetical protein
MQFLLRQLDSLQQENTDLNNVLQGLAERVTKMSTSQSSHQKELSQTVKQIRNRVEDIFKAMIRYLDESRTVEKTRQEEIFKAMTQAQDEFRMAENARTAAVEELSQHKMYARFRDYAMLALTSLRSTSNLKPSKWFRLEDGVLEELEDYRDDIDKGFDDITPLMSRPYHQQLAAICEPQNADVASVTTLIRFYKDRCEKVHSGLNNMTLQQKTIKVKSDLAAIPSLTHLSEYQSIIRDAIMTYAIKNNITIED